MDMTLFANLMSVLCNKPKEPGRAIILKKQKTFKINK